MKYKLNKQFLLQLRIKKIIIIFFSWEETSYYTANLGSTCF